MTNTPHLCPKPGCGMKLRWFNRTEREDWGYHCPRNADAHALCKKVAELEAALIRAWDGWNDRSIFTPEFVTRLAFEARKSKRLRAEKPHDETL